MKENNKPTWEYFEEWGNYGLDIIWGYECSKCKYKANPLYVDEYNYCPNCGAKINKK